ncbi:hypothetical protein [Reichenbachiella ulvae]|uniref:Addiction module component n=1 Tax=Reichenbachiella ulvae TaxID=2980104 RepID=A0ABT3CUY7_9BACT|nr:hypothetical protein [Reichenbachiella ulvae]MCV9387506.1 hypothetical protein [Reichenbachiella ulvae]
MARVGSKYKTKLIDRINSIDNREILDEVNRLLDVDMEESVYHTSEEQKKEIETASTGQGIPSDIADKEMDEWLSK